MIPCVCVVQLVYNSVKCVCTHLTLSSRILRVYLEIIHCHSLNLRSIYVDGVLYLVSP